MNRRTYYIRDDEEGADHALRRISLKKIENMRFENSDHRHPIRSLLDIIGYDCPRLFGELDYTLLYKEYGVLHEINEEVLRECV